MSALAAVNWHRAVHPTFKVRLETPLFICAPFTFQGSALSQRKDGDPDADAWNLGKQSLRTLSMRFVHPLLAALARRRMCPIAVPLRPRLRQSPLPGMRFL